VLVSYVAGAVAAVTSLQGALGAAAQCWAFCDGFVVNRFDDLTASPAGVEGLLVLSVSVLIVRAYGRSGRGRAMTTKARLPRGPVHPGWFSSCSG
jgi:hypothetical protein